MGVRKHAFNCCICGKLAVSLRKHTRFCSQKCHGVYRHNITSVICRCRVCNTKFRMRRGRVREGRGKYCSRACYEKSRGKRSPSFDVNKAMLLWQAGRSAGRIARECGAFRSAVTRWLKKEGLYETRKRGENHGRWKGGLEARKKRAATKQRMKRKKRTCKHPGVVGRGVSGLMRRCPDCGDFVYM